MPHHTVLVLTFDRLPAAMLSCYGNEWIETKNFDRLAAQSAVFEEHYAEIPGLAHSEHPWWTGRFEFFKSPSHDNSADIIHFLTELETIGIESRLVSERASELPTLLHNEFEIVSGMSGLAVDHSESPFARLLDRGIELLQEDRNGTDRLIWLHSQGVLEPWLPNRVFADLYLDELEEADEQGPQFARKLLEQLANDEVLARVLLSSTDSTQNENELDSTFGDLLGPSLRPLIQAVSEYLFAGYVTQLDHLLGRLLNSIDNVECGGEHQVTLLVTAAGGQEFHSRDEFTSEIDLVNLGLTEQLLLTPFIVRTPGDEFSSRVRGLVQTPELLTLLRKLLEPLSNRLEHATSQRPPIDDLVSPSPLAFHFGANGELGIRDSEWFFTIDDRDQLRGFNPSTIGLFDPIGMLFVKPDDIHDVNNVVSQEQEVAARLIQTLQDQLRS